MQVMSKALREAGYYKGKGVVECVLKQYVAQIAMLDGGDVLQVDQAELETVIPQPGKSVLVLQGAYKGTVAEMLGTHQDKFMARVRLKDGRQAGKVLELVYEDVSKLSTS